MGILLEKDGELQSGFQADKELQEKDEQMEALNCNCSGRRKKRWLNFERRLTPIFLT